MLIEFTLLLMFAFVCELVLQKYWIAVMHKMNLHGKASKSMQQRWRQKNGVKRFCR